MSSNASTPIRPQKCSRLSLTQRRKQDGSAVRTIGIKNNLAAYLVVQAESHEAAAKLFEDHPHFTIFPGEAVEIMECLPIPGM